MLAVTEEELKNRLPGLPSARIVTAALLSYGIWIATPFAVIHGFYRWLIHNEKMSTNSEGLFEEQYRMLEVIGNFLDEGGMRIKITLFIFSAINIVLSAANLIPIQPLDGGHLVYTALAQINLEAASAFSFFTLLIFASLIMRGLVIDGVKAIKKGFTRH